MALPFEGPLADDLRAGGVEVLIRPLAVLRRELMGLGGLSRLARATAADALWLRRLVRERSVALVHSNTSVVVAGATAPVPHVWHVRESYDRFGAAGSLYRRLLARADALPCVSAAVAGQFTGARARVVYDGLALDARRAARTSAREALGLAAEDPVVAVLGRVSDWKGQDVLVRALAAPQLRERGVVGLVAGDAWPGAEERLRGVRSLADALGVSDRVVFCGFRDDVWNVYGAADVVAVPSTAPDPLPNTALEAAAAGCAVVASACGGLPEILSDGVSGRLVPPGDAEALADAVAELLDDPARTQRMGAAAAADVRARFSRERLLAEVQDLYDALLSEGRAGADRPQRLRGRSRWA